jgi:hypothetical protein
MWDITLAGLNLVVDLSSYLLHEYTSLALPAFSSVVRRHPIVHHPQLPNTTTLTASSTSSANPISRVLSYPAYEPIMFSNADRY